MEWWRVWVFRIQPYLRSNNATLFLLFWLSYRNRGLLGATFLHFCVCSWRFHCLKRPPSVVLWCWPVFLRAGGCDVHCGENKCIKSTFRNELQLLAASSVLMNHQYILNKVSVTHLNTLRQGYVLVGWQNVTRGSQEPTPCISSRSRWFNIYLISVMTL